MISVVIHHQGIKYSNPLILQAVKKKSYLIQVAAYNKRQDAERLKAMLVLTGFSATISTTQRQTVTWYRVTVGPYNSRLDAEKAQKLVMQGEHMKGIIREIA